MLVSIARPMVPLCMQSTASVGGVFMLWNFSGPLAHQSSVKSSGRGMNGVSGGAANSQTLPDNKTRPAQIKRSFDAATERGLR